MTPSEKYLDIMRERGFVSDDAQLHALTLLDSLQLDLLQGLGQPTRSWWRRIVSPKGGSRSVRGIYLWGGVGRGKTFLMDILFQCLPTGAKRRIHFHQFMNEVHQSLKRLGNIENPLRHIAGKLSREIKVLCLDEFVVIDIADAMIISGLLEALFEQGVVLVTTSNSLPQNLYRDGLQRARFLPAIELLDQNCVPVNIDGGQDYRLQGLQQTHLYMVPHSPGVLESVNAYLNERVAPCQSRSARLSVNGRDLDFEYCAEDTVWFGFAALCKSTRSQSDYLELGRMFNTLILTDIEVMSSQSDDVARRFVSLIDVIYDHRVILICSAAANPEKLYQGKRLAFEFERTASRLIEMRSQQYLAQAHSSQ